MAAFYGKYRGVVINNVDPMVVGRLQVAVPAVLSDATSWALPCSPFAGPDVGLCLIPPVGANVWVEFEGGDVDHPIWSGCFWGDGQYPAEAQVVPPEKVQVLKGYGFKLVANSVGPTGLTIECSPPMLGHTLRIVLNDNGILVSNDDVVTLKLTPDEMALDVKSQSKMSMSASEIKISTTVPSITLSNSSLELVNGGASVKMSPSTVTVNDGALEVI